MQRITNPVPSRAGSRRACAALPARPFLALPCLALPFLVAVAAAEAATVELPRFPALSPDGSVVVFSWRGDLWRAPSTGGEAVRLTANPSSETRSGFTADGSRIVFESDREGMRNLWSIRPDGSDLRRLTDIDAQFALGSVGVFAGKPVAFLESTLEGDLYRSPRPFMLPLDLPEGSAGTPERVHGAFGGAASASPDGSRLLFERGGSPWSRRGYTGPDNRDVWLYSVADGAFTQLTRHVGNDGLPRFIGADEFVYISDRGLGAQNLHRATLSGAPDGGSRLTEFKDADIHGLAVSADGRTAVFGVLGDLWRIDLSKPGAEAVKLAFTAAQDGLLDREFKQVGREVTAAALSPDGKTMAFIALGDVFVRAVEDKSPTRRVTEGEARERDLAWSADGMTLYFVSDQDGSDSIYAATVVETRSEARERGKAKPAEVKPAEVKPPESTPVQPTPAAEGVKDEKDDEKEDKKEDTKEDGDKSEKKDEKAKDPKLDPARWADAVRFEITAVTSGPDDDRHPSASPDGRALVFMRNLGDLAHLDLATGAIRILREGWTSDLNHVWSPDSSLIAFAEYDQDFNADIWIVPADGSKPAVNITRHPDNDVAPRFSADGKILAFLSERTNEEYDAWMVMLDRDLEGLSPRDLDQYFKDAAEAVKKRKPPQPKAAKQDGPKAEGAADAAPARDPFDGLELDDAYLRVRRVTTMLGNEMALELAPTGDRLYFTGSDGKERALFSIKFDGSEQKKLGGAVELNGLSFAGDKLVAVSNGQAQTITPTGEAKTIDIAAESEIDVARRNEQKLRDVSRILGRRFYLDPEAKGLDWAALTERFAQLARVARTNEEFDFVANTFIGYLDSSHLGVRSPGADGPTRRAHGRLGVATVAAEGGRRVTAILPDSPAALASPPLAVGDVVTALDFDPIDPAKPLEPALAGKVGQEVFVGFTRAGTDPDGKPLELGTIVVPVSSAAERTLRYNAETRANARKVEELSGGRLGYIHIAGMDQASLDRFERDLYAAASGRDGLVVDVRNNGGGSTADRLLASIDVRPHAYVVPREGDPQRTRSYPQDRLFIQRYTMPMAMLCNEKSFSNAEIISHAFKTLGRGPLVGQQTAGGVISTGSEELVDGTSVRLPFRGWYLFDGTDMEENGAMPDFVVAQTPEDEVKGADLQLEKAVEELMRTLPAKKSERP
jgi:tricorn protease